MSSSSASAARRTHPHGQSKARGREPDTSCALSSVSHILVARPPLRIAAMPEETTALPAAVVGQVDVFQGGLPRRWPRRRPTVEGDPVLDGNAAKVAQVEADVRKPARSRSARRREGHPRQGPRPARSGNTWGPLLDRPSRMARPGRAAMPANQRAASVRAMSPTVFSAKKGRISRRRMARKPRMFRASIAPVSRQEFFGEDRKVTDRPPAAFPFPAVEKPPPRQARASASSSRRSVPGSAGGFSPLPRLNDVGRGRDAPRNRGRRANTDFSY